MSFGIIKKKIDSNYIDVAIPVEIKISKNNIVNTYYHDDLINILVGNIIIPEDIKQLLFNELLSHVIATSNEYIESIKKHNVNKIIMSAKDI